MEELSEHAAVAVPPEATVAEQGVTVTPLGVDETVMETVPLNPLRLVTVTDVEPEAPTLQLLLVAESEKPGVTVPTTWTVMVLVLFVIRLHVTLTPVETEVELTVAPILTEPWNWNVGAPRPLTVTRTPALPPLLNETAVVFEAMLKPLTKILSVVAVTAGRPVAAIES